MNYLGSDFNSAGSVMAKAELTVARSKRGECVTCARKCYRKKLFKMIPLDEPGKVLNGRCLNCKPLQPKDVSAKSNSRLGGRDSGGRGNRSISNSNNSINGNSGRSSRRTVMYKYKSSSHLHQDQYRHQHQQSSPHLLKSTSAKGGAIDGTEASLNGEPKSPPGRTNSSPPPTNSYHNRPHTARNRYTSTHSSISRSTAETALTTRPSIASSSTTAGRKNTGSVSTLSIGSVPSTMVNINSNSHSSSSSSGRSVAVTDSLGSGINDKLTTKSSEISWTPPPHISEFGSSDDDMSTVNTNQISANNTATIRSPSRLNSIKSVKSTTSKHYTPTREELEQAAFTLMAARQNGLTGSGGPLYKDMLNELTASDHSLDRDEHYSNHGAGTDPSRNKPAPRPVDSIASNSDKQKDRHDHDNLTTHDDGIANAKSNTDESLTSSLIKSIRSQDVEPKHSFAKSQIQELEQSSTIVESNASFPKTESIAEEDDQIASMHSHQHLNHPPKQGILNRGGAYQPRQSPGSGRPGVGTHVFAGSTRTMSSMSSIGEEDHLLIKHSSEQQNSQIAHRRQNLTRMGSFSRYRHESCHTLGSLSTIEVINEEDTRIQSSLEVSSVESFSVDTPSIFTTTTCPKEEILPTDACHDETKVAFDDNQGDSRPMTPSLRTNDLAIQSTAPHANQDEEVCGDNDVNDACYLFQEQFILLRESFESPEQTLKVLIILSECEISDDAEQEIDPSALEALVACIQSQADDHDVQRWGCRAMRNLISSRADIQNAFVKAGAPDIVAQAMKRFVENGEDFQEEAISVLSTIAVNSSNVHYLVDKGYDAAEAIITAMGYYAGNARVQSNGCEAITNLAMHNNSTLRLRIMDKGAGEAILFNAVAMHTDDSVVQESALSAVRNLCTDCEENQTRLLELGVVDPILSAMKKHRNAAGLQEAGAGAISILAGNNVETKKVIEENGGIQLILRAILDHSNTSKEKECYARTITTLALDSYNCNHSESRASEDNVKAAGVVNAIIDAIDTPPEGGTNPPKLSLAIDSVISEMENHEDCPAVQEIGCAILGSLADIVEEGIATSADETKMDIVDVGALDMINMAMVLHKHKARVQERACAVLLSLAIEENYAAIAAAIGINLLQDAAKAFPDRCHELANRLIKWLTEDDENKEE